MVTVQFPRRTAGAAVPRTSHLATPMRSTTCPECSSQRSPSRVVPQAERTEAAVEESVPERVWPASITDEKHDLFVSFAGGGIYFFWQLGAVKFLQEKYDLTKVPMAGASSGSLVACLCACGIDPDLVMEEAYQLSVENDIWNRKFGLLGIWGGLIRDWLDKLLPDDAHELVSHRLHVIIARAPTLDLFEINQFDSKEDLIEAVMASAHVPFFLDGRPFLKYRGEFCWDGSFPDFFYFENSEFLQREGKSLIVDYSMDDQLEWTRGDFLKLRDYNEILEMIDKGYKYMLRQHELGLVDKKFDTKRFTL